MVNKSNEGIVSYVMFISLSINTINQLHVICDSGSFIGIFNDVYDYGLSIPENYQSISVFLPFCNYNLDRFSYPLKK